MRYLGLLPLLGLAQDTLRVLAYNLLFYGSTGPFCDVSCKDGNLRKILSFTRPHLIGINEISPNPLWFRRILDSVLNVGGVSYWRSSVYGNVAGGNLVSAVFYDSRRLGWLKQELITTQGNLRDIYAYHFYYKDPTLRPGSDTLYLVVIVPHLKAGSSPSDAQQRARACEDIRRYIQNLPPSRKFILQMGDHNFYTASEAGYQELRQVLVDPGPAGDWSGNSNFAYFHTQSTRVAYLPDDGVGGGLNDRFDFIFFSPACTTQTEKLRYVPGSFKVIGQDGQHFGQAINAAPLPAGYPSELVEALYTMSDHLPVYAEFALTVTPAVSLPFSANKPELFYQVGEGYLQIAAQEPLHLRLLDMMGKIWADFRLEPAVSYSINIPAGVYLLQTVEGMLIEKLFIP